MKTGFQSLSLALLAATALLTLACGSKVVVTPAPPAPVVARVATTAPQPVVVATVPTSPVPPPEVAPGVSPGSDYVWLAGYYNWVGDHYVWMPGTWVRAPQATAVWIPGRWVPTTGGYMWVPGHWQTS
jgi:hypothetical protein